MSTHIFVRGFDFGTTEQQIQAHCSQAGQVTSVEMSGPGTCVVGFDNSRAAQAAVSALDRTVIDGNTRYIDVKINTAAGQEMAQHQQPTYMTESRMPMHGASNEVFIVGFDFGTTQEQIRTHCAGVGTVLSVEMLGKGECAVYFESPESVQAAVSQLSKTTIAGNSRFIDVRLDSPLMGKGMSKGPVARTSVMESSIPIDGGSNKVFITGFDFGTTQGQIGMHCAGVGTVLSVEMLGKGECAVYFESPESVQAALVQLNKTTIAGNSRFIDVRLDAPLMGKGMSKGPVAATSTSVLIRGFDFGTTAQQIGDHCAVVGRVLSVDMVGQGQCTVQFASQESAQAAIAKLNMTTIAGNRRYIDVINATAPLPYHMTANATIANGVHTAVFIQGFDFGTQEDQIRTHCVGVGTVVSVEMRGRGECVVWFESPGYAQEAVAHLHKTTIPGNSRYIDVRLHVPEMGKGMSKGPVAATSDRIFIRGFDFGTTSSQIWEHCISYGPMSVEMVGQGECTVQFARQDLARAAIANLNKTMIAGNRRYIDVMDATGHAENGGNTRMLSNDAMPTPDSAMMRKRPAPAIEQWPAAKNPRVSQGTDPWQTGRVLVRGFDFGTHIDQLVGHMQQAGTIVEADWLDQGSAAIVYSTTAEANNAVAMLHSSHIPGNRRYIEVISR